MIFSRLLTNQIKFFLSLPPWHHQLLIHEIAPNYFKSDPKVEKGKIGTISFVTVWPSFLSTTLWIFTYASLILDGIGIFRQKILDIFYATIPLIISRKHFTHKYWREFANDSPCPNNDIKMIMWWSMPVNGGAVMSFSHFHSSSSKTKNKLNFILVSRQSREKSNVAKMFQMYH